MATVRTSAKELTSLILDEERLRSERSDRKLWKTRVTGIDEYAPQAIAGPPQSQAPRRERNRQEESEEDQIERAKRESLRDQADRERRQRTDQDEDETDPNIIMAKKLSEEEAAANRRAQLDAQNSESLFDDTPAPAQSQPTGYNQGYQQQPAVDWFGNPLQQQPQSTGILNNQYAQPQQTGYQNGFANGFQQPQATGYNQFGQQPFLQQQNTLQPQQTAFQTNNPYGGQPNSNLFGVQQSQQLQPAQSAGSNNPWATQSPQPVDQLKPLPTGSNNPFAQRVQQPSPSPFARTQTQPSLGTLFESQPATQFQPSQPNPISNYQAPQPSFQQQPPQQQPFQQQQQSQKPLNPHHEKLNALLSTGEGIDTFGNTGELRIPAQHTAPGTFVNSAGQGLGRLHSTQTGTNPFFSQQATGFGPSQGGFGQQVPAQTGPAGGFGGGFGTQPPNQYGGRPVGQQNGSLIDL